LGSTAELESAFDAAMAQTRKSVKSGMMTIGGESAAPYLAASPALDRSSLHKGNLTWYYRAGYTIFAVSGLP
jgi:hypothetical protein